MTSHLKTLILKVRPLITTVKRAQGTTTPSGSYDLTARNTVKNLDELSVNMAVDVLTVIQPCLTHTLITFVLVGLMRGELVKQNAPDNRGTEFVIGYMENLGQDIDVELFVTTMRRANVSVEILAPQFETAGIHHQFNVSYGMVKQVHLPNNIRVVGSSKDTKGVLIRSNDEIVIYGVNKEKFSCDAFLGLPVDVLGTEYYIVTYYPPSDQCELLIVGVDNNTAVTVRFGDALGDYTVRWDGHYYRKGDEIHINLNSFDTFQLVSKGDLSGTHVASDKPISVFSGNKKTKIGRGFSSDHIVEHLTPVTSWGKTFVTVSIPHRTVGDFFRFLASEDNTKIQISGGYTDTIVLKKAGDFIQTNIPSNAYCLVTSDKAIFVAQFVQSQTSRLEPSDPSMIIIPPIEQFASDYTFATPKYSFGSYLNYFLFIVKAKYISGLRLNGKPFPANVIIQQIPGTEYVGGYISIPEGSHNVRHISPISIFGGYLYGRATMESYGFPTGMRMAPINTPCEPTPTVVGDGLDNDCDGLIDEELCVLDQQDNDGDGGKNEDCAMPAPVDGNWSKWQTWEPCSATCTRKGHPIPTGTRTRRRTCTNPAPAHDGDVCVGKDTEAKSCQPTSFCSVDGNWSRWGEWSQCSITCSQPGELTGIAFRHRYCSNPSPQYGGKPCNGQSKEEKECTPSKFCPVDGNWASWEGWSACSMTCLEAGFVAKGVQTRSRLCVNPKPEHGGKHCPGEDEDIKECFATKPCSVDGNWSRWGEWSQCSITCSKPGELTGIAFRHRYCSNPSPQYGGKPCNGQSKEEKECTPSKFCPVDGNWASWEGWSACSMTCLGAGFVAKGVQTRSRLCVNPKPEHSGKHCPGEDEDIKECFPAKPCSVDGNWASWEGWSACSMTCLEAGFVAKGVQTRSRLCVNPKPEHGGKHCPGEDGDIKECFPTKPCSVDGNWSRWGEWSQCSITCSQPGELTGITFRHRYCSNPSPQYAGKPCIGHPKEEKECTPSKFCPVNGTWASWEGWSACSLTCSEAGFVAKGIQTRSRVCVNPQPAHDGKHCPGVDEDIKECLPTNPCSVKVTDTGWSAWSTCSAQCGGGIRSRQRPCDSQSQSSCHGGIVQEDACNTHECVGTMIELETKQQSPPHFTYTKLKDYGFRPNPDNSIVFHVKACSDAHVGLISNDQRVYEVVIGGWSNTKSVIRTNRGEKPKATHNGALLSCSTFRTFYLSWNGGRIILHRNTSNGWDKVMEWQDPNPKTITNVAFTTGLWATGAWRFRGLAMCNCLVSGDPHYTTFDGEQIDFMGTCKYTLSEYRKPGDTCSFAVEAKNERRGSNSKVSYTRLVDVKMFGRVIRLHRDRNVYVDGELTYLPYHDTRFEIVLSGTYVRFASKCGLVVEFDGVSNAWVRVPSQISESFTGICGNCNGQKDDRHDVEVYQVTDDSDMRFQHCMTDTHFNPCSQQVRKEAETNSICRFLNPSNTEASPFKTCIDIYPGDAMKKFESCVYDFCVYKGEVNSSLNTKLCDNLAAFADSCLINGYRIMWRSTDFCPLQCADHSMYNPEGSACPSTCIDPDASRKCTLGTLEGCECEHGYLLSNQKCVKASECGCLDEKGRYYPIGATFSDDCTTVKQCKIEGKDIKVVVVSTRPVCGSNAECGEKDGKHTCVCKRGYQGDPTNSCHLAYECRDDVTGSNYQGTISQSALGNDCLPWSTTNSIFMSIGDHRFCRNPNADQRQSPWCYVQKGDVTIWEYCDIPMCHEEKPVCETTTEITCSSSGNTFVQCRIENAKYITYVGLTRKTNAAECRNGFSFGRFGGSIWTDHGCSGYFNICYTPKKSVYTLTSPPITECKQTQSGTDYTGSWGRTVSGRVCQGWASQYPHHNKYSTRLKGNVNYCRNPGNHDNGHASSQPWCYTTDEHVTWEYCNIPTC
ncbi:uncharacterized protein LOC110450424 isoform X1 [Mizuhopecten yessoensis]|uniref:uncharacterized protein LOC110450424 isoform X1 n=1 Tax=Mizuhopecten yessoensis TaxID=6573 RepID=UPI000B458CB5|nr:uncharacterized protein LOC110450424 isoform X1 [Mizuhopecten yessoensis]